MLSPIRVFGWGWLCAWPSALMPTCCVQIDMPANNLVLLFKKL
jgi:hypothetical protein